MKTAILIKFATQEQLKVGKVVGNRVELDAVPSSILYPPSSPGDVDAALTADARRAGLPPPYRGCGG
jgi:hypothetical protein